MRCCHSRALAGLAGLTCTLLAGAAFADYINRCGAKTASCAKGSMSVSHDVTEWTLTITDYKADGNCAYAKVIVDRNNKDDEEFRSLNVCGNDRSWSFNGDVQYSGTRGARLELCVDRNNRPDVCSKAHYAYEK